MTRGGRRRLRDGLLTPGDKLVAPDSTETQGRGGGRPVLTELPAADQVINLAQKSLKNFKALKNGRSSCDRSL